MNKFLFIPLLAIALSFSCSSDSCKVALCQFEDDGVAINLNESLTFEDFSLDNLLILYISSNSSLLRISC